MLLCARHGVATQLPSRARRTWCWKSAPTCLWMRSLGAAFCAAVDDAAAATQESGATRPLTADDRASIMANVDSFSEQAFRVLAIAARVFPTAPDDQGPAMESQLVRSFAAC